MTPLSVTLSNLYGLFNCLKPSKPYILENIAHISCNAYTQIRKSMRCVILTVISKLNGLLKVRGSHVHCKSCNISE